MKRFLKISALLVISLFLVVSGVDAALDRLSHSPTQSTFTVYNEKGAVVLAYSGEMAACKAYGKTGPAAPNFLHRG